MSLWLTLMFIVGFVSWTFILFTSLSRIIRRNIKKELKDEIMTEIKQELELSKK